MLCLKNVTYHPVASPSPILKEVSLQLAPQEMGLIVGASGSGKTTLLEILAGLAEKSKGQIFWRDQELSAQHLQQLGGIVFQFPERHFCGSSISEELCFGHPEIRLEHIQQALAEVSLDNLSLETSPHSLSGGQQRRLALAVQLIRQPNILLLDEPTAGLDWSMRRQLTKLLEKLKQHWTLLVVSHDVEDFLAIADRCWQINQGVLTTVPTLPHG
ncbi:ABC transporter ATP-binding protein [Gloeocapsa sp. PCC 73106]|uniref:ABC transporter ATP-binding protein n=1 Tax=Gloeocapsa sp. PCC 73106 TaxID=102232 RepID=UPI0002AC58D9|nr:ABC transporter ATP-binding protein [Gloeocapsa sp. PCC 73106]ELR99936.1 ABC-type cobalt transport system, ATPase component [Gloeocapsa sp. PCC 73106]